MLNEEKREIIALYHIGIRSLIIKRTEIYTGYKGMKLLKNQPFLPNSVSWKPTGLREDHWKSSNLAENPY